MFSPNDTSTFAPQGTYLHLEHMLQTTNFPLLYQKCEMFLQFLDAKLSKNISFCIQENMAI